MHSFSEEAAWHVRCQMVSSATNCLAVVGDADNAALDHDKRVRRRSLAHQTTNRDHHIGRDYADVVAINGVMSPAPAVLTNHSS